MEATDGRLSSGAWPFDSNFDFGDAVLFRLDGALFGGLLGGKRSTLAGTFEADAAGGTPADGVTVDVGDSNNGIVKGRGNVGNTTRDGPPCSASA